MGGGANIPHLFDALEADGEISSLAAEALSGIILVSPMVLSKIAELAGKGNDDAW
jgi:hypothetical protein